MGTTSKWSLGVGLGVAAMTPLLAGALLLDEEVSMNQVPDPVRATILRVAGTGLIEEIERETEDGVTVYEADLEVDGEEIEIRVALDGTLLDFQAERPQARRLTVDQIPEAARAALRQLAHGAMLTAVEEGRQDGVTVFEAAWNANGVEHEAAVLADGTLIEREEIVSVDSLPATVRDTLNLNFGRDAKVVVEKKLIVLYEIEGKIDGKMTELLVSPTGRVVATEDDDDDDDDDDEDDDEVDDNDDDEEDDD